MNDSSIEGGVGLLKVELGGGENQAREGAEPGSLLRGTESAKLARGPQIIGVGKIEKDRSPFARKRVGEEQVVEVVDQSLGSQDVVRRQHGIDIPRSATVAVIAAQALIESGARKQAEGIDPGHSLLVVAIRFVHWK